MITEGNRDTTIDRFLNARVGEIIGDNAIMEDIDKQIKQITDGEMNQKSKTKNYKPINSNNNTNNQSDSNN